VRSAHQLMTQAKIKGRRGVEMARPSPLLYLLIAILLMAVLHYLVPLCKVTGLPWRLPGVVPLFVGVILSILADQSFKRHKTTVKPFERPTALVTDGVFRLSRHPMYLGTTLILAAIAVFLGSLTPWFIVPLVAILLDARFIKIEESILEETFGEAYRRYEKQARRWV
jgi:protein-S-isoprenylcysteine O-methyltransferase Ste14